MPLRPPRKCSTEGAGMVIFGVTLLCAFTNLKCSMNGWSVKSTLPDDADAARLGLDAGELDALLGLVSLDARKPFEEIEMPP